MLQDAGVFGHLMDWTPETAYAKMCWVLGHEKKMEKVKEEMMRNIAGEITERSEVL
jgi:glutamyl-tRNA(Gln) amidotransferase subunit D